MTTQDRGGHLLTRRHLNRALLDRQLLLARSSLSIRDAIEQVAGLQTQYAPSGYVGLWTRLSDFKREELTAALEDRSVVQATLLRSTIHMVSGREYWRYAIGVRQARRDWFLKIQRGVSEADARAAADRLRATLLEGPRSVRELGALASGFLGSQGLWVELVLVPPSGTWEHRRADRLGLADDWVGAPDVSEDEALRHIVKAYLRGFGPAAWRDVASWAGLPVTTVKRIGEGMPLVRYRDDSGRELFDHPDATLPDPDAPAPVRFLPHWDNNLLVHARRAGVVPEEYRPRIFTTRNPFSVGTYLVDGAVAGAWSLRDGRVELDPYEALKTTASEKVEAERERLQAFHA